MPGEVKTPLLAVLIDAENASAKIADALFKEIATIGEAAARRIYVRQRFDPGLGTPRLARFEPRMSPFGDGAPIARC